MSVILFGADMSIKFQNSKVNRSALIELGYHIYDPHHTFNRKSWIIIGDDGKTLYGVNRRHNFKQATVEEFTKSRCNI